MAGQEQAINDLEPTSPPTPHGLRVLVVEDEPMLSLALQDMLADLGCVVAGTAARLEQALRLARELTFDIAMLDIDLGGKRVDPVAAAVCARRLPVVFVTGYGEDGAPRDLLGPVLEKPYEAADLQRALGQALGATR
jgi:CheY-like chemotaxis protein